MTVEQRDVDERHHHTVHVPLLGGDTCYEEPKPSMVWRLLHSFFFLLGGTTFIAGTICLFYPGYETMSALLYTIGSMGFFSVDAQELLTLGTHGALSFNIAMSLTGSFLYILGSVGFFPELGLPGMGIWGFILGSAVIGISQFWKTHRIGSTLTGSFSLERMWTDVEAFTAAGVELTAGLGAWCFFFGTIMYWLGPLEDEASVLKEVLEIWLLGSFLFTLGGCFLAFRHFWMGII